MALGDTISKKITELQGIIAREVAGVGGAPGRALSVYVENGLKASDGIIGIVGGAAAGPEVAVSPTTGGSYTTGQYVGQTGVAMVFPNVARVPGGSGVLMPSLLIDEATTGVACELWLFRTAITPPADKAAWTISNTDLGQAVAVHSFSTFYASAARSLSQASQNPILVTCAPNSRNLYGVIVIRGSATYPAGPAGGLNVVLGALQN